MGTAPACSQNLLCYSGRVSPQGGTTHVQAPPSRDRPAIGHELREHLWELFVVCAAAAAVLAFFIGVYKAKHYPMPIGYDTPRYLFQTTLAGDLGLAHVPHLLPPPKKSLATRTGFPVVVLTLSRLFSTSTFTIAAMVPPAAAAALALAAGVLVSWGLRRSSWELGAVTLIVGMSTVMVRLMAPETYTDNLLSTAVLIAALIPILSAIRDGPGLICAMVLLGIGAVIHPQFFALFAAILGLVALVYLPTSWRGWRRGETGLLRTPSARLGLILAGSSALGAVGLLGSVRSLPIDARQTRSEITKKLREDLPLYRYPLVVPVAAMGAAVLASLGFRRRSSPEELGEPSSERRTRFVARFLLALSLAWGLVTLLGVIDFSSGSGTAAHRLLSFLIPLPLLMAVGILGLGRAVALRTRTAAGMAIVLAGIAGVSFLGYRDLYVNLPAQRAIEFMDLGKIRDASAAEAYLERYVPADRPVVFVIDDRGPNPLSWVPEMGYMIRTVLPTERILHSYMYVGTPENYLAGRPTSRATPRAYNGLLRRRFWPTIQRVLPRRPVALLLASYNEAYTGFVAIHPGSEVAPNVALVAGPKPPAPIGRPTFPRGPRGVVQGGILGLGTILVLALAGGGWAVASLPRSLRPFELVALSPAVGIAALVAGGILVDAAGFRLSGAGGAVTPVLVGAAGALVAWAVRRPRRPTAPSGTI